MMKKKFGICQALILQAVLRSVGCSTITLLTQQCQPGFEKIGGSCLPCQPRYFKDSTMIGKPCMACDYVKNPYQEQRCPCSSTHNAVIVCRNDSAWAPDAICKKRSDVQETCVPSGVLQKPHTEPTASTVVTTENILSTRHDRSSVRRAQSPVTPVSPALEVDFHYTGSVSSKSLEILWIAGSITFVIVLVLVSIYFIKKLAPGCPAKGQMQANAPVNNPEAAAQPLAAGSDEDDELPAHLRFEIQDQLEVSRQTPSAEDPQSIQRHDNFRHSQQLSVLDNCSSHFCTYRNDQLGAENSVALPLNPDSDLLPISLGLSSMRS